MKSSRIAFMIALALILTQSSAYGANTIVIESKHVRRCADSVTVGVYLSNDSAIRNFVIPLRFISLDSGSFIADHLTLSANGRLAGLELAGAYVITRTCSMTGTFPYSTNCPTDQSGNVWNSKIGPADFSSPDAAVYAAFSTEDWNTIEAGSDGSPGNGTPSLLLKFGVTCAEGAFEIDTTCIPPYLHVALYGGFDGHTVYLPQVTKGTIDICTCICHTDPNCDGNHDIVDWILIRDVARGSHAPIPDSSASCPTMTTDVNCDGVTNNTDKNLMSEVIFNSGDPDTLFCIPCP